MSEITKDNLNFVRDTSIYIYGEFDQTIAENVIYPFQSIINNLKEKKTAEISIRINSRDGYNNYLYPLIGLVEEAKLNGIVVKTYVDAIAYSCGSLLAISGTPGHRYITEFSEHLLHLGQVNPGWLSTDEQLKRGFKWSEQHFKNIRMLYKKYARVKDLEKQLKDDSYYIIGQAIIDNGLADVMV